MDAVREVLHRAEQEKQEAEASVKVDKLLPPECFTQDLLIADANELNLQELRLNREDCVRNLTRECVQILFNSLSALPEEKVDGKVFVKVANSAFGLPREKLIPGPKAATKWEKFAKEKGIKKTKRAGSNWDDILQKWVPNYGFKKTAGQKEKDWLLEVPQNVDPNTDMFAEKTKTKKEMVAKNEYQRLRNIAASAKIKVPRVAVPPMEGRMQASQLKTAAETAKFATASLGKFQPKLPKEKEIVKSEFRKKKRVAPMDSEKERESNLSLVEKIAKKKPKMNVEKAVNKELNEEETRRRSEKGGKKKGGGRGRKRGFAEGSGGGKKSGKKGNGGGGKGGKIFKKPSGLGGKRTGKNSGGGGRKRR